MIALPAPRLLLSATITVVIAFVVPRAFAQNFYIVGKTEGFVQRSSAGAVADPDRTFEFSAAAGTNVTLALPSGATQALPFNARDQEFVFQQTFASKAALDAAYPAGTYRMTGTGIPALSFNLTADAFPSVTPQVTGGTWNPGGLLVVDPAQTTTISFSTFTGYANTGVAGHMATEVSGLNDTVSIESEIATRAIFGLPVAAAPITTITIPAGRLTNGRAYEGAIQFDTLTTLDTTTVAGGGVVAIFSKELKFFIAAQAPGTTTPAPVIVSQPANQTGVPGGAVTFNLGVTVGGSNQLNNVGSRFYFNGRELNLDGTKYRFSNTGFGLTVTNLTAADAGSYSVMVINAGGIVRSAAATLTLGTPTAPTFARQPASQTVTQGSTVVFSVASPGIPTPTFQWRLSNVDLPGQIGPTLLIPGAGPANAGNYTVVATNANGSATSAVATLTLSTAVNDPGRLINLSILTPLTAGETMTMGTVLGGNGTSGAKPLLARAAGPSLAQLGVSPFLPDPTMALVSTSSSPAVTVASNNDWSGTAALSTAFTSVGAFAYVAANSRDAAIFQTGLAPGNYTVQVSDAGTGTGTVIAELYDATANGTFTAATPRLINVSVLKSIGTGSSLTAGFYIGGSTSKTVLIRAIGPTLGLAPFNIAGSMADPQLTLFNGSQVVIAANNDWGGSPQIVNTANRIGAFAVANGGSRDAMLLITLEPGSYTANVGPVTGSAGGFAIVEVYEVP